MLKMDHMRLKVKMANMKKKVILLMESNKVKSMLEKEKNNLTSSLWMDLKLTTMIDWFSLFYYVVFLSHFIVLKNLLNLIIHLSLN
jgi:hypothetical protein